MEAQRTEANAGFLSVRTLAAYLDCSRTFARGLIDDGELPSVRIRGLRRVRKQDVDEYIARLVAED
jgi:excisionase family DNA binding protein